MVGVRRVPCDSGMRTTARVDDDILDRLKTQAHKERMSLARILNRVLKTGLRAGGA